MEKNEVNPVDDQKLEPIDNNVGNPKINKIFLAVLIFGVLSLFFTDGFRMIIIIIAFIFGIISIFEYENMGKKERWYVIIGAGSTFVSFLAAITGVNTFFLLVFVIIFSLSLWIKHLKSSGKLGENFVFNTLKKLDPEYYKIINDVLLPSSGNTKTTQIDHIVVSNFGIFCIETKDYSGWIFGRATDKYWTQVLYRKKTRFYNPMRQNYAHVKSVENLISNLNLSAPVFSFIAFPGADKLKISGADNVGYARDVLFKIQSFNKQVLSDSDRDIIYDAIFQNNIINENDRENHIDSVANLNKFNNYQ